MDHVGPTGHGYGTDCILCINRKLLQGFEEGKWHDPHQVLRSSLWLLCGKKDSQQEAQSGSRETSQGVRVVQMTGDGGLNQGVSSRGGEKQIQDMFLKVEPM